MSHDRKAQVPMMHRPGEYGYFDRKSFQAFELPYAGGRLAMVVLLPERADGLGAIEAAFGAGTLVDWSAGLQARRVDVGLPRFRVAGQFNLKGSLSSLGMARAFGHGAEFSGIDGGAGRLALSAVVHEAIAEVNEEGTEAAAATGIAVRITSAAVGPP